MTPPSDRTGPRPEPRPWRQLSRRYLVAGAAWAVPAVTVAIAAPAVSASGMCTLELSTSGLASSGFALYLRDTKATNSNTNTSPSTTTVVNVSVVLTCSGVAVPDATVTFIGDDITDGEGNYMIGASATSTITGFGESSIKKIATTTTDATGTATAKISTASYSKADCTGATLALKSGILTITASDASGALATLTLTYQVYDGPPMVSCP